MIASRNLRCIDCGRSMEAAAAAAAICPHCGRGYPLRDGILLTMGELSGKNRIAEAFYDGPRFQKFRFWENLFLGFVGGLKGARRQILRHLPPLEDGWLLEVGIGDGDNLRLLPEGVNVTGIDIAWNRLRCCYRRYHGPGLSGRPPTTPLSPCGRGAGGEGGPRGEREVAAGRPLTLALAEGERIPFADRLFDAVLCVGGFNFFSDPGRALAEMGRVTRSGGRVVVADEIPDLYRYGWGHMVRLPALDDRLMCRWFGPEFHHMVVTNEINVGKVAAASLADWQIHRIWRGYGYCLVGSPP